jgi:arylsulfatase A-like enzyme/Tfp pilus assembly protein PilF
MRVELLAVLAVVAAGCSRAPTGADLQPIPRQNVLLITIDTLRADALGAYGGRAATPALDRLAAEGVRFDFAHAHAVVTLTSHASILTGLYPYQHGLRDNSGYRLAETVPTLAARLKEAGYATAAFVAAFPLHSRFGLARGFDVYDDRFGESHGPTELAMPERPASAVVPLARAWLAEHTAAPGTVSPAPSTFLWVHVFDPHAPYRPPPPFDAQYAARPYDGEVAAVDAALAPLLDDVRRSGRPTLVVVTGDHGESLGEHGEETHGLFAYEATLRVPLIIAELGGEQVRLEADTTMGPNVVSGFSRTAIVSSIAARHVDIVPTVFEAIGQTLPPDLPGRSLLTAAERRDTSGRASYFEAMSGLLNRGAAPLTGILVDRDKLIDLPILERYDLAADPGERVNLAGRAPDRDRALAASLRDYHAVSPGTRVAETPEAIARLRALGYVSGSAAPKPRYTELDDPKRLVELDAEVHRAMEAAGQGRIADAVRIYQHAIAVRPDFAMAYRHLAFLQARQGHLGDAIDLLQRAVGRGLADRAIVTDLAGYLADAGRSAQAIQLLEPLAGDPQADADTLNTLGIAYAQAGQKDAARRTFERVLRVNPTSSVPLENLGLLALERRDLAAAGDLFARAIAAAPRSSRAQAGAGAVALARGDRRAAIEAWTKAVDLDPSNFDALFNLGTTLARAGDMTTARPYLERFLRTAPPAYDADRRRVAQLLRP